MPRHKFEIQLSRRVFSDKVAVSANQSPRYMETSLQFTLNTVNLRISASPPLE